MSELEIKQAKNVEELVIFLKDHLNEKGYKESTVERFDSIWKRLVLYCNSNNVKKFTMDIGRDFIWECFGSKLGDKDTSHNINRAIHMLSDFDRYGMIFKQSSVTLKEFSQEYRSLFDGFLEELKSRGMAKGSIGTWRSRLFRFELFLHNYGVEQFNQIELSHINVYVETLAGFSSGTVGSTIGILQKLFNYAHKNGYHELSFGDKLPTVKRINKYRLPTIFTTEEVELVLKSIDRENPIGKRHYAIFLLVSKLGLRISDVRALKFDSINWKTKTIAIKQKKTGIPLELPLLEDVGWSIIDYLRYGRPESECQNIFVKHCAPYDELQDSFRRQVVKAIQKSGVKTPANKPIGMHTFRHSIATTMLENGAKITDIEQILGHSAPESTEQYISLDVEMLRQCALEVAL